MLSGFDLNTLLFFFPPQSDQFKTPVLRWFSPFVTTQSELQELWPVSFEKDTWLTYSYHDEIRLASNTASSQQNSLKKKSLTPTVVLPVLQTCPPHCDIPWTRSILLAYLHILRHLWSARSDTEIHYSFAL